jgi:hypothetical protein
LLLRFLFLPGPHRPPKQQSMNERIEAPDLRAALAPITQRAAYWEQLPHAAHEPCWLAKERRMRP